MVVLELELDSIMVKHRDGEATEGVSGDVPESADIQSTPRVGSPSVGGSEVPNSGASNG